MSKHLQEEEKSAATTITSTDATRHKEEMKIRGDMVIYLAERAALVDGLNSPEWFIREARKAVEERHRDR